MAVSYYDNSGARQMRRSRVLEKLREGKVAGSFKINLDSARACEIVAMLGYDSVWLDVEHVASDWSLIQNQIYAAKAHDCDAMVRVRRGSYSEYSVPLELDAAGLMVPHIMNLQDAKEVVKRTRFAPIGMRAVDGGNSDGAYCNIALKDYLEQANAQRFVALQIEDPEPLEELDEIAALPGYDILFFGPGDFSHAIGDAGNMDNPRISETRARVLEAALKHGKFAGTVSSPEVMEARISEGFRFLSSGADVLALNEYIARHADEYRKHNAWLP